MTESSPGVRCPRCGAVVSGRFCSAGGSDLAPPRADRLPRLIGGAALIALVAFVAGNITGRCATTSATVAEELPGTPLSTGSSAGAGSAPDISAMSPEDSGPRSSSPE